MGVFLFLIGKNSKQKEIIWFLVSNTTRSLNNQTKRFSISYHQTRNTQVMAIKRKDFIHKWLLYNRYGSWRSKYGPQVCTVSINCINCTVNNNAHINIPNPQSLYLFSFDHFAEINQIYGNKISSKKKTPQKQNTGLVVVMSLYKKLSTINMMTNVVR